MDGVDGRLDLVRPGPVAPQALADQSLPLGNLRAVPEPAVLVGKKHQLPVGGGPAGPPRLREQHQGEQPHDLGLARHELQQQPTQTDGLRAQVGADEVVAGGRRIALVEHQVDDGQHRREPPWEVGLRGDAVGDVRVADLVLGAHDPLRHGGLGHDEGACDLGRGQAAQ